MTQGKTGRVLRHTTDCTAGEVPGFVDSKITHTTHKETKMTNTIGFVSSWLTRLQKAAKRRAMIERTIKELSAMSDRELNDIGINRYDIPRIAGGYNV
jgi:uncharacterized protein YjiS (DUF1127 family)